jgi:predicted transport protein
MDKALETMIANMPEKTGKSLNAWIVILKEKTFTKHSEAVNFLKKEHGVTHGFANTIVHLSKEDKTQTVDLITSQYEKKEALKPIYDALKSYIETLGNAIEFAPKKAYVSVRRKKQFVIIQPSTKTRVDLGLNLKGKEAEGILENSGSFSAMCTHRIRLATIEDISEDVKNWIKEAHEAAG